MDTGINFVSPIGSRPVASTGMLVSAVNVGCCVYPPALLSSTNNTLAGGSPVLTTGFYGIRNNINFFCPFPCPPDILIAAIGSTKNLQNGLPKLRIGDPVGIFGGVVIGAPSNNFVV
jgi:hypothetical protein